MDLFHEEVGFEHRHGGRVQGKLNLFQSWASWFNNHGGFRFTTEDLFADEKVQKVLYRWQLEWPSLEKGFEGKPEKRRGVDVIQFRDGKIILKNIALLSFAFYKSGNDFGAWLKENNVALASTK